MKNVWFFNHFASPPDQAGGSRHYAISRILANRGYRVTLFASSFSHHKHKDVKCNKQEKFKIEMIDGFQFVWIRTFPYRKNNWKRVLNMLSYSWRCLRVYKKLLKENPENPAYGPKGYFHYWGEPEAGYYRSDDPWVIRRNIAMMVAAGVDFIYFDVTKY